MSSPPAVFTIDAAFDSQKVRLSDTADSSQHLPIFSYRSVADLTLPRG